MSGRASQSGDEGSVNAEEEFDGSGASYGRITGQCSYGINQGYVLLLCILSHSLPMYCTSEFGSACLRLPPADSKSSKLRADIDRCLVCIPRALMANGEGTKKKDEERERERKSFPLLLRFDGCRMLLLLLNLSSTATGGLGWRRGVVRWRGGKGGKRVAFQNSFRVRQRLESSVAGGRVAGGWQ